MKVYAVLILVCALVAAAFADSDVVDLSKDNFREHTSTGKWLVEFFAPWCGHCKHLAPTWEKLATAVKGEINIGKVDCTQEREICTGFGIRGYPTIKLVSAGNSYDYKGQRTVEAFTQFAQTEQSNPQAVPAAFAPVAAEVQQDAPKHEDL